MTVPLVCWSAGPLVALTVMAGGGTRRAQHWCGPTENQAENRPPSTLLIRANPLVGVQMCAGCAWMRGQVV